jgi:PmbA protein
LILPPHITTGLLEAAWEAWSGDAAQRGRSFFAGRTGQMVAAPAITLVDDGTLAQGLASAPVDDEGTTTQRTALLSEGRLAGFLYNAESGRRAGARSTGNGQRNGFKNLPSVGPTNFLLLPGQAQPSDLLAEAEAGLYISELMGLHTLDAVTGEFSLGANGRLITKGVLGQPVRGITIAGTVETLLKQVTAIGADLTWYGSIGAPTLLVSDVMVSGT